MVRLRPLRSPPESPLIIEGHADEGDQDPNSQDHTRPHHDTADKDDKADPHRQIVPMVDQPLHIGYGVARRGHPAKVGRPDLVDRIDLEVNLVAGLP